MSIINYAIRIDTGDYGKTLHSIGLDAGIFRFVTGRPGYDGITPPFPTYEGGGGDSYEWFEKFLIRDELSNPNRRIKLELSGDYGTMSGFNFSIKNDNFVWSILNINEIYLTGKKVELFCVIDDVFYPIWSGEITENPYTETGFKFICKDDSRKLHKNIPPVKINKTNYPEASENAIGQSLPVCIGEVPYAAMLNIAGDASPMPVLKDSDDVLSYSCGIQSYLEETTVNNPELILSADYAGIIDTYYDLHGFTDGIYYLRVVVSGTSSDAETDTLIQILSATIETFKIKLYLNGQIAGLVAAGIGAIYDGNPDEETWYVQIVRIPIKHAVSNNVVHEFLQSAINAPYLNEYDSGTKTYKNVSSIVREKLNDFSPASLSVLNTQFSTDGDTKTYLYYTPVNVWREKIPGGGFVGVPTQPDINDRDRATYYVDQSGFNASVFYKVELPAELLDEKINSIALTVDIDAVYEAAGSMEFEIYSAKLLDVYGNELPDNIFVGADPSVNIQHTMSLSEPVVHLNTTPNDFYRSNGGVPDTDNESLWGKQSVGGLDPVITNLTIEPDYVAKIKSGYFSKFIILRIRRLGVDAEYRIKQFGFIAETTVDIIDGSLYARVNGEPYNGTPTNTVNNAFKLLLETYDGIDPAAIDYDNLDTTRNLWYCGRQLVDVKSSALYLKELCMQSFVAMYPSRDGKRKLTAWFDKTAATEFIHNNTSIIRDSIKVVERTKIHELYNEFFLDYSWNPGMSKFDSTFFVTKVDQVNFPIENNGDVNGAVSTSAGFSAGVGTITVDGFSVSVGTVNASCQFKINGQNTIYTLNGASSITGSAATFSFTPVLSDNVLDDTGISFIFWTDYFGGLETGYGDASVIWEKCKETYIRSGNIQKVPKSISELSWFIDRQIYNPDESDGVGEEDSVYKFLTKLIFWITRVKVIVQYSMPINATNITLDLCDYGTFKDLLITNNIDQSAWINKIEIDTKNDLINVRAIMFSNDGVEEGFDAIIETGSAPDQIIESGSQPDQIIET